MAETSLTFTEALEVAIHEEVKAFNMYSNLSKKVNSAATKVMLDELAQQEMGHRKLLEKIVQSGKYNQLGQNVPAESQGIAEFLVATDINEAASPQEVIIFAIKAEIKAFNFYNDFVKHFSGTELEDLFSRLASEEQQHKIKLENEYETYFMRDN